MIDEAKPAEQDILDACASSQTEDLLPSLHVSIILRGALPGSASMLGPVHLKAFLRCEVRTPVSCQADEPH